MKILIDGRFYGLENAGLGRYTLELIDNLQKIDKDNQYFLLLRKKYYKSLKLNKNWEKVIADYRHYSFVEQLYIPLIIRKIKPDITHFLHFSVPLFAPKPYVVTIHDMIMHHSNGLETTTLPSYLYVIKRLVYKFIFRNAVYMSQQVITPANSIKNEIINYFRIKNNKVAVTYLGINKNFFGKNGAKVHDNFLYVGNAYPHKNLKILIETVKKINSKLVIVTSRNVFFERLKTEVEKLNASNNVEINGYVDDAKLKILYQNSIAFIYPSLFEGFGFQGLESMAAGTILLASDIKVFREVYKDNAIYFDPRDKNSLMDALKKCLNLTNTEKQKRVLKAQEYAKNFSWQKTAQKTLNIYEELTVLV